MRSRSLSRVRTVVVLAAALTSFSALANGAHAQMGKRVMTQAGTPEDKAISEIYAAQDGPTKLALLDKFMADFGKGDFALLADQLYLTTYIEQKNYPKAYEYGEKVLAIDPQDFGTLAKMVQAADEAGDTSKVFEFGERAGKVLTGFKAVPDADDAVKASKRQALEDSSGDISRVEYSMFNAAQKSTSPVARAGMFERYAAAFPDSPLAKAAKDSEAFAFQQAGQNDKMVDVAQKNLVADPDDVNMLIMLADYWSDKGTPAQLDKATAYAQKALDDLAAAKKPDGFTDDQWKNQVTLQQGFAYSGLGMVNLTKTKYPLAVDAFKKANPLLKSDSTGYGRNLYRLGFTLAKMKRIPEAKAALTEAASGASPYKDLAKKTLDQISAPSSTKRSQ